MRRTIISKASFGILLLSLVFTGCSTSTKTSTNSFVKYETESLGTELDGSVTLRAWGSGRNTADAVEQAKKNAVRDVIFKGINVGKMEYYLKPIIFEVNAQEKYEKYFNIFFSDGGEYKKYISMADEKNSSRTVEKNNTGKKYGITVRVLRDKLKDRLKSDGIIK